MDGRSHILIFSIKVAFYDVFNLERVVKCMGNVSKKLILDLKAGEMTFLKISRKSLENNKLSK